MPYLGRLLVRDRQWEGQQQYFPTVWKTTGGRLITRGSINVLSDCSDCGRTGDLNLNSINVLALFTATVHVFLQRWTWGSSTRVDLLIMTHLLLRSSAIAVYIFSSGTSPQLWDVASAPVTQTWVYTQKTKMADQGDTRTSTHSDKSNPKTLSSDPEDLTSRLYVRLTSANPGCLKIWSRSPVGSAWRWGRRWGSCSCRSQFPSWSGRCSCAGAWLCSRPRPDCWRRAAPQCRHQEFLLWRNTGKEGKHISTSES